MSACSLTTAAALRSAGCSLRGFAQFELQAPAIVADFRFAPAFERADFGEARAQFDGDQALFGLLAEADDGVERGVDVKVGIGGVELQHLAELSRRCG